MLLALKKGKDKDEGKYSRSSSKKGSSKVKSPPIKPTYQEKPEEPIRPTIKKPALDVQAPKKTESSSSITDVQIGTLIKIENWFENGAPIELKVINRHLYTGPNHYWSELECSRYGETTFLKLDDKDELLIHGSFKKYDPYSLGITTEHLKEIVHLNMGRISVDDILYDYKGYGKAIKIKGGPQGEDMVFEHWKFEDKGGYWLLSFQLWANGSMDVYLYQRIKSDSIYLRKAQ